MKDFKVFILLPAYNESAALTQLLPAIQKEMEPYAPYQIVLADDSSTDDTQQKIKEWQLLFPLIHLRHPVNAGCGAAVRTAMLWAVPKAHADDVILSLDADNTHLPCYFPALIEKIKAGYDIVTASYLMPEGKAYGLSFKRKFLSAGVNLMFRILFPIVGTKAYTTGFRAYRAVTLQTLYHQYGEKLIEEPGFPGGTELFLKARALGNLKTTEIPFTLHYDNRGSASKIRIGKTIQGYLRLIKRFLLISYKGA